MNDLKNKLTPSANSALSNLLTEFEERILKEALSNARTSNTDEMEISASDILNAKKKLFSESDLSTSREHIRRKRLIYFTSLMSLSYAVIGLLMYLRDNGHLDISKDMGLIIAFGGLFIFIFFILFYNYSFYSKKMRELIVKEKRVLDNQIVELWTRIEDIGIKIASQSSVRPIAISDKRVLIDYISEMLGRDEFEYLEQILRIRNFIVHGQSSKLSRTEKEEAITRSYFIIDELENKLKKMENNGM